jgi:hypothetical protein
MFGWFQPQCPLSTSEKAWMELRMNWLSLKLGQQRLQNATVMLPTPEFFPDKLDGSQDDAGKLFRRLCDHVKVDAQEIRLEVRTNTEMQAKPGRYVQRNPPCIYINEAELSDSESLAATLAHELAHHFLLGGGLLTDNNLDLEKLTDLLPVFLGIGLFSANAAFKESHWRTGHWSGWSVQKKGYLPVRMFAYGFSLFAFARGEQNPQWARYLRRDLSVPFWQGLRFLNKTGDTILGEQVSFQKLSIEQLLERLDSVSATTRYISLWEMEERGPEAVAAVDKVLGRTSDRDLDVREMAVRALGKMKLPMAVPTLMNLLSSGSLPLKISAARALGEIAAEPTPVLAELRKMMHSKDPGVRFAALEAVGEFGGKASELAPELWPILEEGLLQCDYGRIGPAIHSLRKIIDNPHESITSFLVKFDKEIRIVALDILDEDVSLKQSTQLQLP